MPTAPEAETSLQSPTSLVVVLCALEESRDVVTYWLTSAAIRTVATADGYEANRLLKAGQPAALVTDRVLPPWPGLDSFRALQAANPALRIAVIEDGNRESAVLARLIGATAVLTRPLSRREVIGALGLAEHA